MKFSRFLGLMFFYLLYSPLSMAAPSYDELFPYYAEVCGMTRMDGGGPGGHAVFYLKGVCRDREAAYPRVRLCTEQDEAEGTVLTVDRSFRNIEWVGIEDRDFALFGGLRSEEELDPSVFTRITQSAFNSKAFQGIKSTEISDDLPKETREYLIAHGALGTDFAVTFARKGSCWKLPVTQAQLLAMVNKANALNDSHQDPSHPYVWNAIGNNCTHFIVNLLAAAKILKPVKTGAIFPENLVLGVPLADYKLITPSSIMVKIANKATKQKIPDVIEAFKDSRLRDSLETFGRFPFQHGVILNVLNFHSAGNSKFQSHDKRMGRPGDQGKVEEMEKNLDLQDLTLNLVTYYGLYKLAEKHLKPLDKIQSDHKKLNTPEFRTFYELYVEWLERSIKEVSKKLSELDKNFVLK